MTGQQEIRDALLDRILMAAVRADQLAFLDGRLDQETVQVPAGARHGRVVVVVAREQGLGRRRGGGEALQAQLIGGTSVDADSAAREGRSDGRWGTFS